MGGMDDGPSFANPDDRPSATSNHNGCGGSTGKCLHERWVCHRTALFSRCCGCAGGEPVGDGSGARIHRPTVYCGPQGTGPLQGVGRRGSELTARTLVEEVDVIEVITIVAVLAVLGLWWQNRQLAQLIELMKASQPRPKEQQESESPAT